MAVKAKTAAKATAKPAEDWSTVPMAHSPEGFAALPQPWQTAEGKAPAKPAKPAKPAAAAKPAKPTAPAPAAPNLTELADRFG